MASDKNGEPYEKSGVDRGGKPGAFADNHSSLQNQSTVDPGAYPEEQREMQSLVTSRRKDGDTPPGGEDDNAPI